MLLGSSVLPSMIWIGGKEIQLGTVVCRAFRDGNFSEQSWNALSDINREYLLIKAIYRMREEAEQNKTEK